MLTAELITIVAWAFTLGILVGVGICCVVVHVESKRKLKKIKVH
jgi:hypothetical protein